MATITFISHDGVERTVQAATGCSLMEAAIWNRVPGIDAACGGDGGCATCQVYADENWRAALGEPSFAERRTLFYAFERNDRSRLACQIRVTEELDGLVVRTPLRQY
jgi:2Fe-2S ferredoxin